MKNNINYNDSSWSPNEAGESADIPNCTSCADSGVYENFVGERDFCECASGCAAEANHDDEMDCDEGGYFEDDADALSSAGMGTDEDYGIW